MSNEKQIDDLEIRINRSRIRRKHVEDKSTVEGTFDTSTLLLLYDLMNKGIIKTMGGVISTGKEANVYRGVGADDNLIAIKIFRINSADQRHIFSYIIGDPRFKHVRKKRHSLVFTWTEKEFKNLKRAEAARVRVPKAIFCKKNILIMEFIGNTDGQAPKLKEIPLDDPLSTFNNIMEEIRKLYHGARLAHADLSEYNILMWNGPVIIDISQAVLLDHPQAEYFLLRDLKNILHFFKQFKIPLPSLKKAARRIMKIPPIGD
ncbi:MAG: serine protein kinase RIO [Candidatus Helarchaeota archaeon]